MGDSGGVSVERLAESVLINAIFVKFPHQQKVEVVECSVLREPGPALGRERAQGLAQERELEFRRIPQNPSEGGPGGVPGPYGGLCFLFQIPLGT